MIYELYCYIVVAISSGWSYWHMLLDTESSVGKECEEQGWWLHGGHTTKGAVYSIQFCTFGQRPFLGCYIKAYLVLNGSTGFIQITFIYFHFFLFPLLKRFENHCIKHDLFTQLHLLLQLKQPVCFEMLPCALYSQEFWAVIWLNSHWGWLIILLWAGAGVNQRQTTASDCPRCLWAVWSGGDSSELERWHWENKSTGSYW